MAIGFLRNSGTALLKKQLDVSGQIINRGRSVWHSLQYNKSLSGECEGIIEKNVLGSPFDITRLAE